MCITFIVCSCLVAETKFEALMLYLLLDNAFMILILAEVGFIGLFIVFSEIFVEAFEIVNIVINAIGLHFLVGNFRILCLRFTWSKCEVILTKIILVLSGCVFVGIGCFILITQVSFLTNISSDFANKVKDYCLLYVFGLFSLFLELYSKLSNIDGTGDHKYHYSTIKPSDE